MNDVYLLHQLISRAASTHPNKEALCHKAKSISYAELWENVNLSASGFFHLRLDKNDRIAVYLPKQFEAVTSLFGALAGGYTMVPVNPVLKSAQVGYILRDCNVRVLVSSIARIKTLADELISCPDLRYIILTDGNPADLPSAMSRLCLPWGEFVLRKETRQPLSNTSIDSDMASILYTSGSTGKPKGVVLSHKNMLAGAMSVAEYLKNSNNDRLLAVLPFSFDYGLSQLTTAFSVGASVVLLDYLLPKDVIRAVAKYRITGLAAVPPLWNQIAGIDWPDEARKTLRYITNSGGAMPKNTTKKLQASLPNTNIYLMYGLTEAFRSTYLPPEQVEMRPDSIGKAIPNAEVMVVREDGTESAPGEPGELVHRGSLVAMGYWNDPEKTNIRFKPAPSQSKELTNVELAVWSGDKVRKDEEGYLYFVGRSDEMIKTSGYRVSPTEVEEVVYAIGGIGHAVAIGIPHPILGQAIVLIAQSTNDEDVSEAIILQQCKTNLPNFMVPAHVDLISDLPRNPNGKIDRTSLKERYFNLFENE